MSEIIDDIKAAVKPIVNRTLTTDEAVQVHDYLNTFTSTKQVNQVRNSASSTTMVKSKTKKVNRVKKHYQSWGSAKVWFDVVLNGSLHEVTEQFIIDNVPQYSGINKNTWRNRLVIEAKKRGFNTVSMTKDGNYIRIIAF